PEAHGRCPRRVPGEVDRGVTQLVEEMPVRRDVLSARDEAVGTRTGIELDEALAAGGRSQPEGGDDVLARRVADRGAQEFPVVEESRIGCRIALDGHLLERRRLGDAGAGEERREDEAYPLVHLCTLLRE